MTATNHSLTGALIGLSIGNPVAAVGLAFVSHFVLDFLPHFGMGSRLDSGDILTSRWFKMLLMAEVVACFMVVATLYIQRPEQWWLACIAAFIAASPDLYSLPIFLQANGKIKQAKMNAFRRFHKGIQHEYTWGILVEMVWLAGCLTIFWKTLQ
ncbi:MAG: hypothetical protein QG629_207 [Patescibacteria group bacterium]|nr:hypothetical protein [Candidatus Saccharibacteria bacterium]MDQ5963125.1 hypothetical protein [Patescibacteria group bacterium]